MKLSTVCFSESGLKKFKSAFVCGSMALFLNACGAQEPTVGSTSPNDPSKFSNWSQNSVGPWGANCKNPNAPLRFTVSGAQEYSTQVAVPGTGGGNGGGINGSSNGGFPIFLPWPLSNFIPWIPSGVVNQPTYETRRYLVAGTIAAGSGGGNGGPVAGGGSGFGNEMNIGSQSWDGGNVSGASIYKSSAEGSLQIAFLGSDRSNFSAVVQLTSYGVSKLMGESGVYPFCIERVGIKARLNDYYYGASTSGIGNVRLSFKTQTGQLIGPIWIY